ncbi:MAG: translocation/assembly module TamB domain-containing protein [bacterium]
MEGILSGSVSLAGKMSDPEVTGDFGITGARIQDTRLERVEGHLKYLQEQFNFSFRGSSETAGQVRIWGKMAMLAGLSPARLSLHKDRPFELQVDAPELSVDLLDYFIPWLTDLSGKASLYAHIKGTPASPEWNGKTRLMNVSCNVPEWGLSLSSLSGVADIKDNVVRIPEITVFSGGGRAKLAGGFRIQDYSVADLDLKLEADNFKAMNTPDINASVDADLSLRGDLDHPRFGGKVKFTELTYRPPLILAYEGTSWETPDPTIRVKGEEKEIAESSPLLDRGDLDIKITIPDHARLRNSELNIRFGGELRVRKPPGGFFLLFGDLETHDGWLIFQGKPFRIERGVFTFPAIPVIDPSLDLLASYRVPDYTTYIKVTGTLSEPSVELYSDPPLDPADVLSVILFGRPMSELSSGEEKSLAETGGRLAASYAAANLASSLGMALNLDTIVVETGETPEESGVGIGKYVNEKLYLYYFQQFGEEAEEEFRVRYDINKNFSVEATQDAEGQGGVDVYYTYTY